MEAAGLQEIWTRNAKVLGEREEREGGRERILVTPMEPHFRSLRASTPIQINLRFPRHGFPGISILPPPLSAINRARKTIYPLNARLLFQIDRLCHPKCSGETTFSFNSRVNSRELNGEREKKENSNDKYLTSVNYNFLFFFSILYSKEHVSREEGNKS